MIIENMAKHSESFCDARLSLILCPGAVPQQGSYKACADTVIACGG